MTDNLKIAYISNTDGAQFKFRGELMKRAKMEGYDVTSIASIDSPEGSYSDRIDEIVSHRYSFPFFRKGLLGYIQTVPLLYNNLIKNKYQIIHCFGHETALPVLAISHFLPSSTQIIITFTGLGRFFAEDGGFLKNLLSNLICKYYKFFARNVEKFICLNSDDLELSLRKISKNSISIRGEGLIEPALTPSKPEHTAINCIYAGRLMRDKGIVELLQAIKKLNRNDMNFLFAGKIDADVCNEDVVKDLIAGNIYHAKYIDFVTDIHKHIGNANVVLLPTKYKEGMPMILIEALAFDKFIISANAPGVNDIFADGCHGIKLERVTVESILAALENLSTQSISEKKGVNREIFLKHYKSDAINKKIISLYRKHILSGPPK